MSIVAGADFGTLSVRVFLFDKKDGRIGSGTADYPLKRSTHDPNLATQSHAAQMDALACAMRIALDSSHVSGDVTSLGSAIFAFVACGDYASVEEAQDALCPAYRTQLPDERESAVYDQLYPLYREIYFSMGLPDALAAHLGHILPTLRQIAAATRTGELQ